MKQNEQNQVIAQKHLWDAARTLTVPSGVDPHATRFELGINMARTVWHDRRKLLRNLPGAVGGDMRSNARSKIRTAGRN